MDLPSGYEVKHDGEFGAIAFRDKHHKIFKAILPEARAKLEVAMKAFCNNDVEDIPVGRFKFQKQYSSGGKMTRIEAFKVRHVRIYGSSAKINDKLTFLVTGVDVAKKTDKADQGILDAAGKAAHGLIHTPANNGQKK